MQGMDGEETLSVVVQGHMYVIPKEEKLKNVAAFVHSDWIAWKSELLGNDGRSSEGDEVALVSQGTCYGEKVRGESVKESEKEHEEAEHCSDECNARYSQLRLENNFIEFDQRSLCFVLIGLI